jgi:AcrR family transcriptional regulator
MNHFEQNTDLFGIAVPRVASCPDVRTAIVEAATALMERFGYQKMTIDDIAREVGIGKATIYGYFDNKQEVGLAVFDGYHREIGEALQGIASNGENAKDRVREIVLTRVMTAFDIASRYRSSVDESMAALKPLVIRRRGRFGEQEASLLAGVIREGTASGEFGAGDPDRLARIVLTCASGLMPYSLSSKDLAEKGEVRRQANEVMDLILRGLIAGNAASGEIGLRTDELLKSH